MRGIEFVALQLASAAYTTDQFPDDWQDLSEEERDEWLSDHEWEPLEGFEPSDVYELITNHASSIKDAFTLIQLNKTNDVKNALIAREIIAETFILDDHESQKNDFIERVGTAQGFTQSPYQTWVNLQRGAESLGLQTYLVLSTESVEPRVQSPINGHVFNDAPPKYDLLYLDHEDKVLPIKTQIMSHGQALTFYEGKRVSGTGWTHEKSWQRDSLESAFTSHCEMSMVKEHLDSVDASGRALLILNTIHTNDFKENGKATLVNALKDGAIDAQHYGLNGFFIVDADKNNIGLVTDATNNKLGQVYQQALESNETQEHFFALINGVDAKTLPAAMNAFADALSGAESIKNGRLELGHGFSAEVKLSPAAQLMFDKQNPELQLGTRQEESMNKKPALTIDEIRSVGWLNNGDGSIALSICVSYQLQPYFVSVSKEEFSAAGGIEGFKNNKHLVMDFYEKFGEGRPEGNQTLEQFRAGSAVENSQEVVMNQQGEQVLYRAYNGNYLALMPNGHLAVNDGWQTDYLDIKGKGDFRRESDQLVISEGMHRFINNAASIDNAIQLSKNLDHYLVINIDTVETAAFQDLGREVQMEMILKDGLGAVKELLSNGQPVGQGFEKEIHDFNRNYVGDMWVLNETHPKGHFIQSAARFEMKFDADAQQILRDTALVNLEGLSLPVGDALRLPGASFGGSAVMDGAMILSVENESSHDDTHDHLVP